MYITNKLDLLPQFKLGINKACFPVEPSEALHEEHTLVSMVHRVDSKALQGENITACYCSNVEGCNGCV